MTIGFGNYIRHYHLNFNLIEERKENIEKKNQPMIEKGIPGFYQSSKNQWPRSLHSLFLYTALEMNKKKQEEIA